MNIGVSEKKVSETYVSFEGDDRYTFKGLNPGEICTGRTETVYAPPCRRCHGTGKFSMGGFNLPDGGVCYRCDGRAHDPESRTVITYHVRSDVPDTGSFLNNILAATGTFRDVTITY